MFWRVEIPGTSPRMTHKKDPQGTAGLFLLNVLDLGLADGFVGAGAFAGAAVDALVGVDLVGGFTL